MNAASTRARHKAKWVDTEVLEDRDGAPALWNPAAAANWSLLFTPVFGAALHMKNWRALGDEQKAGQAKMWMIASLVILLGMMLAGIVLPESTELDRMGRSVGMAVLLGWYFTAARAQQKLVKERFGKNYERRGWAKPIGMALLAIGGVFCVMMIIAVVAGA